MHCGKTPKTAWAMWAVYGNIFAFRSALLIFASFLDVGVGEDVV